MKIIVQKESDIPGLFKEAVHILAHVRYYTNKWENDHGSETKERKKLWERNATEFLNKISADGVVRDLNQVKVEIKENE